jgi:MFS family permease
MPCSSPRRAALLPPKAADLPAVRSLTTAHALRVAITAGGCGRETPGEPCVVSTTTTVVQPAIARLDRALGGPARRRVVVVLALVLALDAADKATLGAVAAELQHSLGVTNLQLGILAAVSVGMAGLATVPLGVLTDRVNRTRLLAVSIVLWSGTLVVAGAAGSFAVLLSARAGLGALGATSGPTLASLVGDYFPTRRRAQFYGYILAGEILGAGFGFVVSGEITAVLSWRWGFWVLVAPGLVLAWWVWRRLPEPVRGGPSRIPDGAAVVPRGGDAGSAVDADAETMTLAQEIAREAEIEPDSDLVLEPGDPDMPLPAAIRYVLRVPTNRILIIASALGWFFFAGMRTFAVIFVRGQYGVGQAAATGLLAVIGIGALAGVLVGGRVSDALIRRGHLEGRVLTAFTGYALTPILFAPAVLSHTLWVSTPLFLAGTFALGAANPPVDAGRLDVMHHRLWGRAEGVRTLARTWSEALAPIAFGGVAEIIAGGSGSPFSAEGAAGTNRAAQAVSGIKWAFIVMLAPLAAGALIGLRARRTYPRDVASAGRSEQLAAEE